MAMALELRYGRGGLYRVVEPGAKQLQWAWGRGQMENQGNARARGPMGQAGGDQSPRGGVRDRGAEPRNSGWTL